MDIKNKIKPKSFTAVAPWPVQKVRNIISDETRAGRGHKITSQHTRNTQNTRDTERLDDAGWLQRPREKDNQPHDRVYSL